MALYLFKRSFCWAYFWVSLFSEGLIIGGNFAFQNGLDLTIKTASTNSPWVYIWEGLLSEGYLRLRFGGFIFGRTYFWGRLIIGILQYILKTLEAVAVFPQDIQYLKFQSGKLCSTLLSVLVILTKHPLSHFDKL